MQLMKKPNNLSSKDILMAAMAAHGVTAKEYADFLKSGNIDDIAEMVAQIDSLDDINYDYTDECDYDYTPMPDAGSKTLKLKIQLKGMTKPPMWREVLVPANFNFTQLHYIIQAVMGLDNCHLWVFQRKPFDQFGPIIGIPKESEFSFGIDDCNFIADDTPLTAFLAAKGDKLTYVYDFITDWIFTVTVADILDHKSDTAQCVRYKSDLQAVDSMPVCYFTALRDFHTHSPECQEEEIKILMNYFGVESQKELEAYIDDKLFDLDFVNEELESIPDQWEPID